MALLPNMFTNWGTVDFLLVRYRLEPSVTYSVKRLPGGSIKGVDQLVPVYRVMPTSGVPPTEDGWFVFDIDAVALYDRMRRIALQCQPQDDSCTVCADPKTPVEEQPVPGDLKYLPLYQPTSADGFLPLSDALDAADLFCQKLAALISQLRSVVTALMSSNPPADDKLVARWLGQLDPIMRSSGCEQVARLTLEMMRAGKNSICVESSCFASILAVSQACADMSRDLGIAPTPPVPPAPVIGEYTHTQVELSSLWKIQHGLNEQHPNIITVDNMGRDIEGTPVWATATVNYLEISFSSPMAGIAVLRG